MSMSALIMFATALILNAGTPGPSIAALVARVLSTGYRDIIPFLLAMWVGEAIWLSLAVWGLAAVALTFHLLFVVIKWAGVAYLLLLAWRMWHAPVHAEGGALPASQPPLKMFGAGLAVTLGNPKIMLFYLALVPSLIDLSRLTLAGWAQLTATMLLVLFVLDMIWVVLAAQARKLLIQPRAVRIANRCSAGMMGGAAAAIAAR